MEEKSPNINNLGESQNNTSATTAMELAHIQQPIINQDKGRSLTVIKERPPAVMPISQTPTIKKQGSEKRLPNI